MHLTLWAVYFAPESLRFYLFKHARANVHACRPRSRAWAHLPPPCSCIHALSCPPLHSQRQHPTFPDLNNRSGYQSVPVEEYAANLKTIVDKLRSQLGVTRTILLAPPPVDDSNPYWQDGTRSSQRVQQYAAAAIDVAREKGLPYIDLFTLMQVCSSGGYSTIGR